MSPVSNYVDEGSAASTSSRLVFGCLHSLCNAVGWQHPPHPWHKILYHYTNSYPLTIPVVSPLVGQCSCQFQGICTKGSIMLWNNGTCNLFISMFRLPLDSIVLSDAAYCHPWLLLISSAVAHHCQLLSNLIGYPDEYTSLTHRLSSMLTFYLLLFTFITFLIRPSPYCVVWYITN